MEHGETVARQAGFTAMELFVAPWNKAAFTLYDRCGFQPYNLGRQARPFGREAGARLHLIKPLNDPLQPEIALRSTSR